MLASLAVSSSASAFQSAPAEDVPAARQHEQAPLSIFLSVPRERFIHTVEPLPPESPDRVEQLGQLPGVALDVTALARLPILTASQRLSGRIYLGASEIDPTGRESSEVGLGLEASGAISANTQFALSFVQGPADIISALAISGLRRPTVRAIVKGSTWSLAGGDFTSAQHALAGPVVRADGVHLQVNRRGFADLSVGRPKYFGGGDGGHVVQGRAGFRTAVGTLALVASEITRPPQHSTTIGEVRVREPQSGDEAAELDDLRRLLSRESHVRGVGVETDLRLAGHSLLLRAGSLQLESHSGVRSRGAAAEARYAFTLGRGTLSAYARHAPPSVLGTYVPGDALSLASRVPLGGDLVAIAHGYSNTSWLIGQPGAVRSHGASAGVQHGKPTRGLSVQANYRELRSATLPQFTRSLTFRAARPFGPVELDVRAEVGENQRGEVIRPLRVYQARFSLGGEESSVWFMGSLVDHGFYAARTRADVGGDFALGKVRVEAGAGYGQGQLLGDLFAAWSSIEVPLPGALALLTGMDYVTWNYGASPYLTFAFDDEQVSPWRFNIGLRRAFGRPVPAARPNTVTPR